MFTFAEKRENELIDTEIYKNYFLFAAKRKEDGRVTSVETKTRLDQDDRQWLRRFMKKRRTVGFNSKGFDLAVIYAAIEGRHVEELKEIADSIIVGRMKPWEIEDAFNIKIPRDLDHIDLIEVAPGKASLKVYNGRLHGRRMQDLPYEPSRILSPEEIDHTYDYCVNDLDATGGLFDKLTEQLALRHRLSVEYGIDLRSKSDAQIAETIIKTQVGQLLGKTIKRPEVKFGMSFRYKVPDFIQFRHPELKAILREIEGHKFRLTKTGKVLMPDALSEARIHIGKSVYRMGIGGLHSSEDCVSVVADDDHILIDRDVTSYYPYIIMTLGLAPRHMSWAFGKVYRKIVMRRLKAKESAQKLETEIKDLESRIAQRNDDGPSLMEERLSDLKAELAVFETEANSLKITINGSFGKFGSQYSTLFSPELLIQTTITGQLSLLLLIEWLESDGIPIVSANTDGIVIRCPKHKIKTMDAIVREWEDATGFGTEATEYSALYSANVNNYIAVKTNGEVKLKGYYAKPGLMKNPQNQICNEAVIDYITKGTPVEKTIRECKDIRKFLTVRTVDGGAIWGVKEVQFDRFGKRGQRLKPGVRFDTSEAEYLGKAIRWYYSNETDGSIHYKRNGNRVPRSDGARPLMELPDNFPDDIDYRWYIRESREILKEIAFHQELV